MVRASVAFGLVFGYCRLESTSSNFLVSGCGGLLATTSDVLSSELTNVSLWMSSSPPHWLFPSSVCTGRRRKTQTGPKVKPRSPTTSLQQTRKNKNNNCPINCNHFSHQFYPGSTWPHLQHPFWEGTSATLRLETRWRRRTQSCKWHRLFAFLPPWQSLPSRPEEVWRKESLGFFLLCKRGCKTSIRGSLTA